MMANDTPRHRLTCIGRPGDTWSPSEKGPLFALYSFTAWLKPLRKLEWVVYAKRPFAGPQTVLAYLSRYTHRVAIANSRLIAHDEQGVTFKWKDYRQKKRYHHKTMTLETGEFIRRFLIHVLPQGFHRIRHYGLFANTVRANNLTQARELLQTPPKVHDVIAANDNSPGCVYVCQSCGSPMTIIEILERAHAPRAPPAVKHELH